MSNATPSQLCKILEELREYATSSKYSRYLFKENVNSKFNSLGDLNENAKTQKNMLIEYSSNRKLILTLLEDFIHYWQYQKK